MLERFNRIILDCARDGMTDVHMAGAHPLVVRKNGKIQFKQNVIFQSKELDQLAKELLTSHQLEDLRIKYAVDFALSIKHIRLRINIFTTWRGLSFAIRILPGAIPALPMLNILPIFKDIIPMREGLVLFCGPTGSGKTSTIAGIIHEMNRKRTAHIITLEDPVEYRFPSGKSFIQQREYHTHFHTFEQGLIDVLREDPDVILVGELRDAETMRLALDAAESGHLVIATMHSASPEETILRFVNSFPSSSQEFARNQLAASLQAIFVQTLSYESKLGFRVPIFSVLRSNPAVRTIIRENKTSQIASLQQLHTMHDMHTPATYREQLFKEIKRFYRPEECFRPSFEQVQEATVISSIHEGRPKNYSCPSLNTKSQTAIATDGRTHEAFNIYIQELDAIKSN